MSQRPRRRGRKRARMSLSRRVKSIIQETAETKRSYGIFDNYDPGLITTVAAVKTIIYPGLDLGTDTDERVGSSVRLRSFRMNLQCYSTGNARTRVRVVVFKFRGQSPVDAATTTQMMPFNGATDGITAPINFDDIIVKYDKFVTVGSYVEASANVPGLVHFKYSKTWTDQTGPRITYSDPLSDVPSHGAWMVCVVKDVNIVMRVDGLVSITYQDL